MRFNLIVLGAIVYMSTNNPVKSNNVIQSMYTLYGTRSCMKHAGTHAPSANTWWAVYNGSSLYTDSMVFGM